MYLRCPGTDYQVHPHVCGEQGCRRRGLCGVVGSSPRMWGTAENGHADRFWARFIPTYVGNRRRCDMGGILGAVHPHVCGEQVINIHGGNGLDGSSPRMWGTAEYPACGHVAPRFIPTYVGNSTSRPASGDQSAVHPHVRGEQRTIKRSLRSQRGSSPRTWGTGPRRGDVYPRLRFIPTYVGNSPP